MLRIDHVVLYAGQPEATLAFYRDVLGFHPRGEAEWRRGDRPTFQFPLDFINVHPSGSELHPRAAVPAPGTLDICFLSDRPLSEMQERLAAHGIEIEVGPAHRTTAGGAPGHSIYFRDPDGNLIEVMSTTL